MCTLAQNTSERQRRAELPRTPVPRTWVHRAIRRAEAWCHGPRSARSPVLVAVHPLARVVDVVPDPGVVGAGLLRVVGEHLVHAGAAVDSVLLPVPRAEEVVARTAREEIPRGRADEVVGLAGYEVTPAPAEQAIGAAVAEEVVIAVPAAEDVVAVAALEARAQFGVPVVAGTPVDLVGAPSRLDEVPACGAVDGVGAFRPPAKQIGPVCAVDGRRPGHPAGHEHRQDRRGQQQCTSSHTSSLPVTWWRDMVTLPR